VLLAVLSITTWFKCGLVSEIVGAILPFISLWGGGGVTRVHRIPVSWLASLDTVVCFAHFFLNIVLVAINMLMCPSVVSRHSYVASHWLSSR
jgi:hypothetical protein